jgi:hypothetical protein
LRVEFRKEGCETEESPLLKAVAMERLMIQQAVKILSGFCGDL